MKTNSHNNASVAAFGPRGGTGISAVRRGERAFTMVEVALALGVIAFALVGILGVLPLGVRVQKDNREDTIVNQDGQFILEAIRSGSRRLDELTNAVDWIAITNYANTRTWFMAASPLADSSIRKQSDLTLTNGETIIGLLSTPKYEVADDGSVDFANYKTVTARVRSISGSAVNRDAAARDIAFSYLLTVEVVPFSNFSETPGEQFRQDTQARLNFYDLRLTLRWPVIEGAPNQPLKIGGNRKTFRTLVAGRIDKFTTPDPEESFYFVQPNSFIQAKSTTP